MIPVPVRSTPEPKNLVRKGIGYLMVTRTYVLPMPVDGQVVMVIWVSVRPGFRDDAAFLTTERAAAASFCSAIARTPSRAAAEMVPCTWNPRPNSAMPSTSTMSSGTMKANSTALAPRSPRMRLFIPHLTASLVCADAAAPTYGDRCAEQPRLLTGAEVRRGWRGRCRPQARQ